ncbi:MAG: hypothetical protein AAGJ93_16755 [Bacteroidota bacterium]
MKKLLILSLFLSAVFLLHAQEDDGFKFSDQGHDRALRFSLIHFLDPITPCAQLTYEYRLRYNTYLQHEFGVFFDYGANAGALANLNGFRFRTARRTYRRQNQAQKRRTYWEVEADYRYIHAESRGDFQIRSTNGNGSFNRSMAYSVFDHSVAFNYNRGSVYKLGRNWQFDWGFGGGVRTHFRHTSDLPLPENTRAIFLTNGDLFWRYNNGTGDLFFSLSLAITASLGYQF